MQNIRVQFTVPNVEKVVNLDVKVNGENRLMKFRVETFDFELNDTNDDKLVSLLRSRITDYDHDWHIYHIGTPAGGKIPVTFRYKG